MRSVTDQAAIFRVRRLALAAMVGAGGEPQPWQWRRAALEPFDEYVPPDALLPEKRPAGSAGTVTPLKRLPGPQF